MYLLDTHTLLWWLSDPEELSEEARSVISNSTAVVYLSAVVLWEIRLKESLGKLLLPKEFDRVLESQSFEELPIRVKHAQHLKDLPTVHSDPFDRMLVSQAEVEGLTVITRDKNIRKYRTSVLQA